MLKLIWTLLAIWFLGGFAMIARLWYFQILLLNNRAPGSSIWGNGCGFFDSSGYNPAGQKIHREMLRFYWKTVAYGLGGLISIAIIASLLSLR
jgi:hypothetical protein